MLEVTGELFNDRVGGITVSVLKMRTAYCALVFSWHWFIAIKCSEMSLNKRTCINVFLGFHPGRLAEICLQAYR